MCQIFHFHPLHHLWLGRNLLLAASCLCREILSLGEIFWLIIRSFGSAVTTARVKSVLESEISHSIIGNCPQWFLVLFSHKMTIVRRGEWRPWKQRESESSSSNITHHISWHYWPPGSWFRNKLPVKYIDKAAGGNPWVLFAHMVIWSGWSCGGFVLFTLLSCPVLSWDKLGIELGNF